MRALVILLVLTATAYADDDKAKAEQYFHAGAEAFKKQSFEAAAEQFELAYKEMPLPEIAFSAAQAYRRQYFIEPKPQYVKRAVELYHVYLDAVKHGGRVADASDGLAEMQRELDKLTAQGTKIDAAPKSATRIAISPIVRGEKKTEMTELSMLPETSTTAATATLDGKPAELFTPIDVAPGDHAIDIAAPGYFPQSAKRHVVEGSTELVELTLEPKPAHLVVETAGDVTVDGKPSPATVDLAAGHHTVVVEQRGHHPVLREVDLRRGETTKLEVELEPTAKRRVVPWVLGGGGVLVAASVTTALIARSHDETMQKLEDERVKTGITADQLAQYHHEVSKRDAYRDAAYITGGAALATGAVAAALYFLDSPRLEERTVVPIATPGGAGISLVGRW
ncbi:MAG: PEGA domain-containing protein [Deltaproteobacteria bacterium]|nr:PEGA domain-containing protein [Deltaproteobacteria bacterium]